jgi:hypothetical protein
MYGTKKPTKFVKLNNKRPQESRRGYQQINEVEESLIEK